MKKFPMLIEKQVAVVIADGATGHVFNLKLELYRNDSEDELYWIFENIDLAKEFIHNKSVSNNKLEFLIYDKKQNILEYLEATYWKV
ncbi:hypothetical protein RB619_13495 [Flavobacterium sp. LHD-80]|uniref:hypothetical protein n=1 Tax=Flavobacterium sp. LHD-80 TaxID=3071411 RepID=UPI0027DF3976|nr:hypothetical protein [Flavobacterium sp. LHD-80]MDQ6471664.1 hypothetical protein [Flavobacterium sp. LHD-80]